MPELPRGTVTFAFTDIEGSTKLLKQLGDGYAEVLSSHRHLVRGAFGALGGVEIDTQGDAFFYAFGRAGDAVSAAARVQREHAQRHWPQGAAVRVRIGLHTGEPTLSEEGYVGLDVVRAARLCGSCRGGQVLLSQVTKALVGPRLPEGVEVFPVGARELKDIDEPEVVYELGITGVPVTPESGAPDAVLPRHRNAEPPNSSAGWEERIDDWAANLESAIERRVRVSVERSLERGSEQPSPEPLEEIGANLDSLKAGMAGLSAKLRGQLAALFEEIQSDERDRYDS
jgi:class 3 adenylate cyclase